MNICDTPIGHFPVEALVLDFDNVIVRGSENCKRSAWFEVFPQDEDALGKLKEAQTYFAHGKGDRYDILGRVFNLDAGVNLRTDAKVIEVAEKYNRAVQKCILGIGIEVSDLHSIMSLGSRFPLHIISATPQEALHATLEQLCERSGVNLFTVFDLVLGTPKNKVENFELIAAQSSIPLAHTAMVGDGLNDYKAALECGTQFIGVRTKENAKAWEHATFSLVDGIDMLPALLAL